MFRRIPRKGLLLGTLVLVLAGGVIAAVAATGSHKAPSHLVIESASSAGKPAHHTQAPAAPAAKRDGSTALRHGSTGRGLVAPAARYLGISVKQLRSELKKGKSLAQIAAETPGKTEAGLVSALVGAKKKTVSKTLAKRVATQVKVPGWHLGRLRLTSLSYDARLYLGLTNAQLRSEMRSGKSLGQIARATSGKSEAGLIAAMIAARRQQLEAAAKSGGLSAQAERARMSVLQQRVTAYIHRVLHVRGTRTAVSPSS